MAYAGANGRAQGRRDVTARLGRRVRAALHDDVFALLEDPRRRKR